MPCSFCDFVPRGVFWKYRGGVLKLYWLRVKMSYHIFNHLAKLLSGYLAAKIGRGNLSCDLMDREYKCSLLSNDNSKCVYECKCWKKINL